MVEITVIPTAYPRQGVVVSSGPPRTLTILDPYRVRPLLLLHSLAVSPASHLVDKLTRGRIMLTSATLMNRISTNAESPTHNL